MHCKNAMHVTCLVYLVVQFVTVTGHTITDAKKLLADKLQDYDKTFRPIFNQSAPLVVSVGLELVSIQEFDEVQEKLTIAAVVELFWADEYMKWNPSDYGGLEQLVIESDKVWTPNLVLTNNVEKLEKIGDAWQVIRFFSDGTALYYPGDVFSASCRVDVTYYPWDRHRCGFSFSAWAQIASEIVFLPSAETAQTTYFSENGAWTFYNSSVQIADYNSFIEFYLYLERKPRFVLVNVIVPIIFMAFLNVMIFAIPVESGERISYSITVLLAIAVFLTLVGDNLPKTSSPMSIFSYYLLVVLAISICITLATIFNVRLYYKDDKDPVHGCLKSFVRCINCKYENENSERKPTYSKIIRGSNRHSDGIRGKEQNGGSAKYIKANRAGVDRYEVSVLSRKHLYHPISNRDSKFLSMPSLNDDNVYSERKAGQLIKENVQTDANISWKDVSVAFDKIFFAISFLIIMIATVAFFLYIFVSERH